MTNNIIDSAFTAFAMEKLAVLFAHEKAMVVNVLALLNDSSPQVERLIVSTSIWSALLRSPTVPFSSFCTGTHLILQQIISIVWYF